MKIYDFHARRRGTLLAPAYKRPRAMGGWLVRHPRDATRIYKVTLTAPRTGWQWTSEATPLDPTTFGTAAVCFCMGKPTTTDIWEWYVLATPEWNRSAIIDGFLTLTPHPQSPGDNRP